MRGFTPHKMAENRGLIAPPTPPVGVTNGRSLWLSAGTGKPEAASSPSDSPTSSHRLPQRPIFDGWIAVTFSATSWAIRYALARLVYAAPSRPSCQAGGRRRRRPQALRRGSRPRSCGTRGRPVSPPLVTIANADLRLCAECLKVSARLYTGTGLVASIASRSASVPSRSYRGRSPGF